MWMKWNGKGRSSDRASGQNSQTWQEDSVYGSNLRTYRSYGVIIGYSLYGSLTMTSKTWSQTTSKHQTQLRRLYDNVTEMDHDKFEESYKEKYNRKEKEDDPRDHSTIC
ncbi:MAG: hypothetical protein ACW99G_01330 [Candidatus Thorarchaeota archaeon]|jgi:hypothetical protein